MAVSLTNEKNIVYAKGDTCLSLNPFDNYRLFTLYENWKDDDRKTLDLSGNQKLYLIFKTKKKEIRISEYDTTDSGYTVDKSNGQVLFKISKKNATDILSLDDKTFYITRVHNITDTSGETVSSSDEEVLYTGQWKDESSSTASDYTSKIKSLLKTLEERNQQIKDLQESNAELMKQNVEFATEIEEYKEEIDNITSENTVLEEKVAKYESGETYEGTVLEDDGTTIYLKSVKDNYTEAQWEEIVKSGLETLNS